MYASAWEADQVAWYFSYRSNQLFPIRQSGDRVRLGALSSLWDVLCSMYYQHLGVCLLDQVWREWRHSPDIKSTYCSCKGPGFGSQHLCLETHGNLQTQLLTPLASVDTYTHEHTHNS